MVKKAIKKSNGEGSISKYKNGWRASITVGRDENGKLIRKQFYGKTKTETLAKMDEYKSKNAFGLISKNERIILQEWMFTWLTEYKINDSRPSTLERYHGLYRNYIKNSQLGIIKLKDLKASNIQVYYNGLISEKNKSANTIKSINKLIKAALNQAQKEQFIILNPCNYIKLPKIEEKKEIEAFSLEEQRLFIKSLENHRLRALFKFALGTGLRIGEIIAIRWTDIDFKTNEVTISRTFKRVAKLGVTEGAKTEIIEQAPKTKYSARTIPIPSSIIKELKDHKKRQLEEKLRAGEIYADNDLIFPNELGQPLDARNLTRSYQRALKRANIPYRKFHALRHTYATRLFENGIPLKTIQVLLGHSKLEITSNIYTHVLPEQKIKAVEVLNNCL